LDSVNANEYMVKNGLVLSLFSHPLHMPNNTLISQQRLLGIKITRQFLLVRNNPVDSMMALPADTDTPVRHFFLREKLAKILLPVYCPGDEMVLRQRLFTAA
jgi:hypothetical protein